MREYFWLALAIFLFLIFHNLEYIEMAKKRNNDTESTPVENKKLRVIHAKFYYEVKPARGNTSLDYDSSLDRLLGHMDNIGIGAHLFRIDHTAHTKHYLGTTSRSGSMHVLIVNPRIQLLHHERKSLSARYKLT